MNDGPFRPEEGSLAQNGIVRRIAAAAQLSRWAAAGLVARASRAHGGRDGGDRGGYTAEMSRVRRLGPFLIALALLPVPGILPLAGCQQALFPRDAPRTQFEMHRQMRGQYTPLEEPDVFGNPQPALRARLSQNR